MGLGRSGLLEVNTKVVGAQAAGGRRCLGGAADTGIDGTRLRIAVTCGAVGIEMVGVSLLIGKRVLNCKR